MAPAPARPQPPAQKLEMMLVVVSKAFTYKAGDEVRTGSAAFWPLGPQSTLVATRGLYLFFVQFIVLVVIPFWDEYQTTLRNNAPAVIID